MTQVLDLQSVSRGSRGPFKNIIIFILSSAVEYTLKFIQVHDSFHCPFPLLLILSRT